MIYLDNAATTLVKPESVYRAMYQAARTMSSPGRGGYASSTKAEGVLLRCREEASRLFDVGSPEQVVFTFNATHALNIAIKSLVRPGDRVLISGYEHNAVTRTLSAIKDLTVDVFCGALFDRNELLEDFKAKIRNKPTVVICTHVSNVFGYILPIGEIARICRERDVWLIVDASQSAGCIPVEMKKWEAAFVALPGHKGLYGPQGTGLLLCGHAAQPLMEGGTGSESKLQTMPDFLPDRLEAGTHNVPGIAGLLEGLRYVSDTGIKAIGRKEKYLMQKLIDRLKNEHRLDVFAPEKNDDVQSGVLSLRVKGKDCHWVAEQLAREGIAVRSGLHCAPLAHSSAGTLETGTVRVSVSAMTRPGDIDTFASKISRISRGR